MLDRWLDGQNHGQMVGLRMHDSTMPIRTARMVTGWHNGPSTSKFLRTSFPDLLAGPGGAGLDVGPRSHIDIWLVFARNPTFRKNFEVEETCSKKVENSRSEKTPWGLAGWPLAKGAGFSESLCVFWKVGLLREKTVHRLERATTSDVHPHY